MYIVMFKDENRNPRAWGVAELLSEARERATWELHLYVEANPSKAQTRFGKSSFLLDDRGKIVCRVQAGMPYSPSKARERRERAKCEQSSK